MARSPLLLSFGLLFGLPFGLTVVLMQLILADIPRDTVMIFFMIYLGLAIINYYVSEHYRKTYLIYPEIGYWKIIIDSGRAKFLKKPMPKQMVFSVPIIYGYCHHPVDYDHQRVWRAYNDRIEIKLNVSIIFKKELIKLSSQELYDEMFQGCKNPVDLSIEDHLRKILQQFFNEEDNYIQEYSRSLPAGTADWQKKEVPRLSGQLSKKLSKTILKIIESVTVTSSWRAY